MNDHTPDNSDPTPPPSPRISTLVPTRAIPRQGTSRTAWVDEEPDEDDPLLVLALRAVSASLRLRAVPPSASAQ